MKFIIPQNYNFKNKLFGLIDYYTAFFNFAWAIIILVLIKLFSFSVNLKICIFITLYLPLLIFSVFGFNNENIVYVIFYIIKYFLTRTVYFFSKD